MTVSQLMNLSKMWKSSVTW